MTDTAGTSEKATIYRLVTPDHVCPYGLKSLDLLERNGLAVEDHHLTSEAEATALRERLDVETTPQTFIDGELVGTLEDLRRHFGKKVRDPDATTYRPVLVLFAIMFVMALGAAYVAEDRWISIRTGEWFVAFTMCGLAYLKLRDVESFSTMFLNYDVLARRWVPYAYLYPYGEALAGLLMIPAILVWISAPIALAIGSIGAFSVVKAVFVEQRELKCACVGGDSNVPLGFVSLSENLAMIAMGLWMGARHLL